MSCSQASEMYDFELNSRLQVDLVTASQAVEGLKSALSKVID